MQASSNSYDSLSRQTQTPSLSTIIKKKRDRKSNVDKNLDLPSTKGKIRC